MIAAVDRANRRPMVDQAALRNPSVPSRGTLGQPLADWQEGFANPSKVFAPGGQRRATFDADEHYIPDSYRHQDPLPALAALWEREFLRLLAGPDPRFHRSRRHAFAIARGRRPEHFGPPSERRGSLVLGSDHPKPVGKVDVSKDETPHLEPDF